MKGKTVLCFFYLVLGVILVAAVFTAENGREEEEPAPTNVPETVHATPELPISTPTPEPPLPTPTGSGIPEGGVREMKQFFAEGIMAAAQNFSALTAMPEKRDVDFASYLQVLEYREEMEELSASWKRDFLDACGMMEAMLEERYEKCAVSVAVEGTGASWKYLGVIRLLAYEDVSPLEMFDLNVDVTEVGERSFHISVKPELRSIGDCASETCNVDDRQYLCVEYLYAYLNSLFDENGIEKDFVQPETDEAYLSGIGKPLDRCSFKDKWLAKRSKGVRKHAGLDMRAGRNKPIYSCTEGTVTAVGYDDIAGNFVLVRDSAGYEYHYYHMIRQTEFLSAGSAVKKGDLIGHVGNTGNSDANHLHLTVLSPDYGLVNPYPLMRSIYRRR